jgi:hypothetical protein
MVRETTWRTTTVQAEANLDPDLGGLQEVEEALDLLHLQRLDWVLWLQRRFRIALDLDPVVVTGAEAAQIHTTVAAHLPTAAIREARVSPIMPGRALLL